MYVAVIIHYMFWNWNHGWNSLALSARFAKREQVREKVKKKRIAPSIHTPSVRKMENVMLRFNLACINIVIILLPSSHTLLLSTRRLDMHQNVYSQMQNTALNLRVRHNLRRKKLTSRWNTHTRSNKAAASWRNHLFCDSILRILATQNVPCFFFKSKLSKIEKHQSINKSPFTHSLSLSVVAKFILPKMLQKC